MSFWDSLFKPNIEKLRSKQDVQGLIKALNYKKDDDVRISAIEALSEIGDMKAFSPLKIIAQEMGENKRVRQAAVTALGKFPSKQAAQELIRLLSTDDDITRRNAYIVLIQMGEVAVEPLISTMEKDKQSDEIEKILLEMGDVAVEPLITILRHNNESSKYVVRVLAKINNHTANEALETILDNYLSMEWDDLMEIVTILDSSGWKPKKPISKALVSINRGKNIEKLTDTPIELLIHAYREDDREKVKVALVNALGQSGNPIAIGPLTLALESEFKTVRVVAAEALGKFGESMINQS